MCLPGNSVLSSTKEDHHNKLLVTCYLVKLYFSSLRSILDQHAPVQMRLLPIRPHSPWYTDEITQAKKERRRCEKQWRDTGLTVHYQIYIKQRNLVKWMITDSKRSYFKDKIEVPQIQRLYSPSSRKYYIGRQRVYYLNTHLKR